MKKFLSLLVVVAMVLVCFAGCGGDTGYTANNTELVIGMSGPLTGGASVYGMAVKNSAQMAIDEINAAGGLNGISFKLIAMDDVNDPTKIATNYASLYESGMQLSLGTVTTKPGLEWKNLSLEDNVFFLTPSASGDDVPTNPNGYQMCFADSNQGAAAAEQVNKDYQGQTVGVLYKSDDPYSTGILAQFEATLDSSITLLKTSFTDSNATDFGSQIDTLKTCKFVFMPIYYTPASLFMIQGKDIMPADAVYYGCDGLDGIASADGFDINSIPQEVSMLSHFDSSATAGAAKDYIDKYTEQFGKDTLNQFGASAYDCVYAMYNAMKQAADQITVTISASDLCEILKAQFNNGFTYTGVTGDGEPISWNSDGFVKKTAVKYIVKAAAGASEPAVTDDEG